MYKSAFAAAAIAAAFTLAAPAHAVTSGPLEGSPAAVDFSITDPSVSFTAFYLPTDPLVNGVAMTFTALDDLIVSAVSISATDVSSGADIDKLSFTMTNGATGDSVFTTVSAGSGGIGFAFFDDFSMSAGEQVSLIFSASAAVDKTVTLGMTFEPVPVPAALPLMLTALGGAAVVRARKSK